MSTHWRVGLTVLLALMAFGCANPGVRYAKAPPRSPDFQGSLKSVDLLWVLPKSSPVEVEYKTGDGHEYMVRAKDVSRKLYDDLRQGFAQQLSAKLKQAGVCVKSNDASESSLMIAAGATEASCSPTACTVKLKTTVSVSSKKDKKIVWKDEYEAKAVWPLVTPISVSSDYYANVVGGVMRDQIFSGPRC